MRLQKISFEEVSLGGVGERGLPSSVFRCSETGTWPKWSSQGSMDLNLNSGFR